MSNDQSGLSAGSGSFANYFSWTLHAHATTSTNYVQSGEWVTVHLQWADVTSAAGTYSVKATGVAADGSGSLRRAFGSHLPMSSIAVTYPH